MISWMKVLLIQPGEDRTNPGIADNLHFCTACANEMLPSASDGNVLIDPSESFQSPMLTGRHIYLLRCPYSTSFPYA
jgi:hypothetical protein